MTLQSRLNHVFHMFVVVLAALSFVPMLSAQQLKPPKAMQICTQNGCDMLTWTGEYYESRFLNRYHNSPEITQHWTVKSWSPDSIHVVGTYLKANPAGQHGTSDLTATMNSSGDGATNATLFGTANGQSASRDATITWSVHPTIAEAGNLYYPEPRNSLLHPNIMLPPYAAEEFAGFPNDVRAILQPSAALTHEQAQLPCSSGANLDDTTMLEIGKFALREAEFDRGHCWVKRTADKGDRMAETILGVTELMAWGTPQDFNAAYQHLEPSNTDHLEWGLHFLITCYAQGLGVKQNAMAAGNIQMNMMRRGQTAVDYSIGADDGAVVSSYREGMAFLNPPTTSREVCNYNLRNQAPCHTETVVDQKRLQQQLDAAKK